MKKEPSKKAAATPRDQNARKTVALNRRARHEYEILETFQAGMVLVGTEVKSFRAGGITFQDSYCKIENGEVWLYNMYVAPYEHGNRFNVEPVRRRKLLLHRWEIQQLRSELEQKGLTLVPLSIYFQRGYAKIELGLGRGKKLFDKRETIAERDRTREAQREMSGRN